MRRLIPLRRLLPLAVLAFGLLAGPAIRSDDQTEQWRVLQLAGHAQGRLDDAPFHALAEGETLPPGTEIVTEPGGKLTIAHGKDRLTVSPATRLQIVRRPPGTVWDRLLQSFGSVIYDVEPRKDRTFGVDAPYLAAVVKGTKFVVTVKPDQNSVHVDRGRVEVTSSDGVSRVMVEVGQTAIASPTQFRGLQLSSAGAPVNTETLNAALEPVVTTPGAANGLGGALNSTADAVSGTVTGAVDAVGGAVSGVGGAVGQVTGAVGGVVGQTTDAVGGVVSGVGGAVSQATGAVGGTVGAVGGAVGQATGAVGGAVGAVGGAVGQATGGVGAAVGQAAGDVGGALGGAAGGTADTSSDSSGSSTTSSGSSRGGLGGALGHLGGLL